jgi:hypothetical protein
VVRPRVRYRPDPDFRSVPTEPRAAAARRSAPRRSWLAASITNDLTDIPATTAARAQHPDASQLARLLVGGGSALLTPALAAAVQN